MIQFQKQGYGDDDEEAMVQAAMSRPDFADRALITDYLAGELSPAERARFEIRLENDESFRELAEPLMEVWDLIPRRAPEPDDVAEAEARKSWERLRELIEHEERTIATKAILEQRAIRRRRWALLIVCIAIAIAIAIAVWLIVRDDTGFIPRPSLTGSSSAPAVEQVTRLPDDTRVTLVGKSRLSSADWNTRRDERTVNLDGETSVDVQLDAHTPSIK